MVVSLVHFNHFQKVAIIRGPALDERRASNLEGAEIDQIPRVRASEETHDSNSRCNKRTMLLTGRHHRTKEKESPEPVSPAFSFPLAAALEGLASLYAAVMNLVLLEAIIQEALHFSLSCSDAATVANVKLHQLLFAVLLNCSFQFSKRGKLVPNFHVDSHHVGNDKTRWTLTSILGMRLKGEYSTF